MRCPKCGSEEITSRIYIVLPATYYHKFDEFEVGEPVGNGEEVDKESIDNCECGKCFHGWIN